MLLLQGRLTTPAREAQLFGCSAGPAQLTTARRSADGVGADSRRRLRRRPGDDARRDRTSRLTTRAVANQTLVFLVSPGPGGGGGGGGLRQPAPAGRHSSKVNSALKSPVPLVRAIKRAEPEPRRPDRRRHRRCSRRRSPSSRHRRSRSPNRFHPWSHRSRARQPTRASVPAMLAERHRRPRVRERETAAERQRRRHRTGRRRRSRESEREAAGAPEEDRIGPAAASNRPSCSAK